MNETLKKLVAILEDDRPELQIAAVQVLGEIGDTSEAIQDALLAHLHRDEKYLTPFILEALSQLATPRAVDALVDKLRIGGSTADRVAHLLGTMGSAATGALAEVFGDADSELRARVLGILGKQPMADAAPVLLTAVLQADESLSAHAAETLGAALENEDDAVAADVVARLEEALEGQAAGELAVGSVAQALGLLGRLDAAGQRATLLRFTGPKQPPAVRKTALEALTGVELTPAQAKTLLGYVEEQDMTHVARPAMEALDGVVKWGAPAVKVLESMLTNRREERRLFALRALVESPSDRMVKPCLKFLLTGGPEFQDAAVAALANNPDAAADVLRAFQSEKVLERSRLLGRAIGVLAVGIDDDALRGLIDRGSKQVQAGEPAGDVIVQTVALAFGERGVSGLVDKAMRLRRAKKFQDAANLLVRLAQSGAMPAEGQYQLAVTRLILDHLESERPKLAEDEDDSTSSGDATMGHFAKLVRDGFGLIERLKKESQLAPEALLRVGRHFADGVQVERRFGADLLEYVASKHSRARAGEEARLIMRAEGL